jgi:citrate synthase
VELLVRIDSARADRGLEAAVTGELKRLGYVPGFGHRLHPVDPRRTPLLRLVEEAVRDGVVPGRHLEAAKEIERRLDPLPMNIDGATAVIYAELGFPAPLARGFFVLSRSVGILAHAWEEAQQGRRIKSPLPPRFIGQLFRP